MTGPSTIWYTRCPLPAASGIAQRTRNLHQAFALDGIAVETIRTSPDRAVRDSHFTHDHPALFREGGYVPPIWTRSLGQPTALVGISWTDETQAVLVRPDSGIEVLADLKGRRLALPQHDTRFVDHARAHTLNGFLGVLKRAGLQSTDGYFIDIAETEYEIAEPSTALTQTQFPLLDALLEGSVDAIYVSGTRIAKFRDKYGLKPLRENHKDDGSGISLRRGSPRPITVNRDLAVNHPKIVGRYLAVLQETAEWSASNPVEALAVLAEELHSTPAGILAGHGPDLHRQLHVRLTADYVGALDAHKNFLRDHGFISTDFELADWIVAEPLALAAELSLTRQKPASEVA